MEANDQNENFQILFTHTLHGCKVIKNHQNSTSTNVKLFHLSQIFNSFNLVLTETIFSSQTNDYFVALKEIFASLTLYIQIHQEHHNWSQHTHRKENFYT